MTYEEAQDLEWEVVTVIKKKKFMRGYEKMLKKSHNPCLCFLSPLEHIWYCKSKI